jgi:hypothetical protein
MSRMDRAQDMDPSSEAMLAEHERISGLYLHNVEMGEKRTSLYLTVISSGTLILLGLAQFRSDMTFLLWPSIGFLIVMILLGLLTFQRLIERRVEGIRYLRAINRIHRYFVEKDPSLEQFYEWAACDDFPAFIQSEDTAFSGLRDIIALLNSLLVGFLIGEMVYAALRSASYLVWYMLLGLIAVVIAWIWQQKYENDRLSYAEKIAVDHVRFARNKGTVLKHERHE